MKGFDFSENMRAICDHMTRNIAALNHIHMERVAVGFSHSRGRDEYGVFASLTPLRFEKGSLTTIRKGNIYTLQRYLDANGVEYLYLLKFYLPRFMNMKFEDKAMTIVHELLHISEAFDGDIRRFKGRCYAHSSSQKDYDKYASQLASLWLAKRPPEELYTFLHDDYDTLYLKYGGLYGKHYPAPKLIRVNS